MKTGKYLKMIVYTRKKNGETNIEEIKMPLTLRKGKGELIFEMDCAKINEFLKSLNEKSDYYEEISYCFSEDDETVTIRSLDSEEE